MEKLNPEQESLLERENRLASYRGEDEVISFKDKQKKLTERAIPQLTIMSKIPTLDKYVEGFDAGDLIVISGKTKHGKTLLAQTLTKSFSDQGKRSLWFSYEVIPEKFLRSFPELPDAYLPDHLISNALAWIEDKVIEAKIKHDITVVFIDHLHFLIQLAQSRNVPLEIGAVVRGLKKISISHAIIIFLICHTEKVGEGKRPRAANVRDSGLIVAEADTTLLLWRLTKRSEETGEYEYTNQAKISVDLCRKTGVMGKTLKVEKIEGLLREITSEPKHNYTNPLG